MYTIVNNTIVHVIAAGERNFYRIAEDYSINNDGSGSAALTSHKNYRLDKTDGTLQINQAVVYDGYRDAQNPYFYATENYYNPDTYENDYNVLKPISKAEADNYLANFPKDMALDLIPFSEYDPNGNEPTVSKPQTTVTQNTDNDHADKDEDIVLDETDTNSQNAPKTDEPTSDNDSISLDSDEKPDNNDRYNPMILVMILIVCCIVAIIAAVIMLIHRKKKGE